MQLALANYTARRSRHGVVNVYNTSSGANERPKLSKTIDNLTTSITSLRFNFDSQLLAMASDSKKDQMRMVRTFFRDHLYPP